MRNCDILWLAEETAPEGMTNVTPQLVNFLVRFLIVFGLIAVVGVLTPRIAAWIDAIREKHSKPKPPQDPREKQVRGIYDAQESVRERDEGKKENPKKNKKDSS